MPVFIEARSGRCMGLALLSVEIRNPNPLPPPQKKKKTAEWDVPSVQSKMDTETNFVVTVDFTTKVDHQTTSKISFRSCLMIDLGRETDGNNEICLGVHFALCIIKSSTTRSYWALFLGRWSPFYSSFSVPSVSILTETNLLDALRHSHSPRCAFYF